MLPQCDQCNDISTFHVASVLNAGGMSGGMGGTGGGMGGGMGGMGGGMGGMTTAAEGIPAEAAAAGQTSLTTDDLTWLRGVQQTDEDGMVEFETIVPGWYAGRTPHIHIRVSEKLHHAYHRPVPALRLSAY